MSQALATAKCKKDSTQRFYETVRKDYHNLYNKRYKGKRVYTTEYICEKLADKYFRSSATIENIVWNRV